MVLDNLICCQNAKDQSIFLSIFMSVLSIQLKKFHGYKMSDKGPKSLIKSSKTPRTEQPRKCNFSWVKDPLHIYCYTHFYKKLGSG